MLIIYNAMDLVCNDSTINYVITGLNPDIPGLSREQRKHLKQSDQSL